MSDLVKDLRECTHHVSPIEVLCEDVFDIELDSSAALNEIADRIEAEEKAIIEAQNSSAHHIMATYAKSIGKPFRDDKDEHDTITSWLDHWHIAKPTDQDGKPWEIWDQFNPDNSVETKTCIGFEFNHLSQWLLVDSGGAAWNVSHCTRPEPPVLAGDGLPIDKGQTIYRVKDGEKGVVASIGLLANSNNERIGVNWDDGYYDTCSPIELTHVQPDSYQKLQSELNDLLDSDALMDESFREDLQGWFDRYSALIEREN